MPNILTPIQDITGCARTIQLFTFDPDSQKVLLVHEKGDEKAGTKELGTKGKKPAGSGLPGGGVDENKSEEILYERILRSLLPVYRIDEIFFREMPWDAEVELKLFLTAITEGIEETGLLIRPTRILFEDGNSFNHNHKVIVALGQVIAGNISKRSIETDGCDWFDTCSLPWDTYHSHVRRIIRALKVLGRDDLAVKVMVQEKPEEKKTLEAV
ncbi:MAG: hypothetical protein HYT65_02395 [Candidatus Yanofskybacteria bacterium]|nr:hypothetical protein [Candidatus Yanofskybacteria bacterium]